jgi:predicted hotdog family 3-hydroxylacyl-ACP dehydratase
MSDQAEPLLLREDEELFALSVIEYAGNLAAAYTSVYGTEDSRPAARGRALLSKPHILARVIELQSVQSDTALLTLTSHLVELASIRDLAKSLTAVKVALDAERSRGEVMGLYNKVAASADDPLESRIEAVRATIRAALAVTES